MKYGSRRRQSKGRRGGDKIKEARTECVEDIIRCPMHCTALLCFP